MAASDPAKLEIFLTPSSHVYGFNSASTGCIMLQYALLWLFHLILALKRFVSTLLPRRQPKPLRARRRKLPGHLAVLLRHEESQESSENQLLEALESVRRLALWCRIAGIRVLSVYDEEGLLLNAWEQVHEVLQEANWVVNFCISGDNNASRSSDLDAHLNSRKLRTPLTPPLSKSGSLSSILSSPELPSYRELVSGRETNDMQPQVVTFTLKDSRADESAKKRQLLVLPGPPASPGPLTIHLLSKISGKPHLAQVTRDVARSALSERTWSLRPEKPLGSTLPITPQTLSSLLQDPERAGGWPCPDLLLIHTPTTSRKAPGAPMEFEGFPPWQMDLTEIAYIPPQLPQTEVLRQFWKLPQHFPGSLNERTFRAALDEYDGAEMRFGK